VADIGTFFPRKEEQLNRQERTVADISTSDTVGSNSASSSSGNSNDAAGKRPQWSDCESKLVFYPQSGGAQGSMGTYPIPFHSITADMADSDTFTTTIANSSNSSGSNNGGAADGTFFPNPLAERRRN
jgi:hypothetical protein